MNIVAVVKLPLEKTKTLILLTPPPISMFFLYDVHHLIMDLPVSEFFKFM